MAKLKINIGFANQNETSPGVFEDTYEEKPYICELFRQSISNTSETSVNPNFSLGNRISIVVDDFLKNNISKLRYIVIWNNKWKVSKGEIEEKRLIISFGEVFSA